MKQINIPDNAQVIIRCQGKLHAAMYDLDSYVALDKLGRKTKRRFSIGDRDWFVSKDLEKKIPVNNNSIFPMKEPIKHSSNFAPNK